MTKLTPLEIIIAKLLVDSVTNKKGKFTYSEVTDYLLKEHGLKVNPWRQLSKPLGNISTLCYELGLPLLSVRVQYKETRSVTKIADGFYKIACELKPEYKNMTAYDVWKLELKLVSECNDWQRLLDYIDDKNIDLFRDDIEQIDNVKSDLSMNLYKTVYPDDLPDDSVEYREGKKKSVLINVYERNPAARQKCIDHYGTVCYICKFNFSKVYGNEFNGMIVVHHLKMISECDDEYIIDPENDLRPVCPNCHMVIHCKENGVYSIDEVKKMMELNK